MIGLFKETYRPRNYSNEEIRSVLEQDKAGKLKKLNVLKSRLKTKYQTIPT